MGVGALIAAGSVGAGGYISLLKLVPVFLVLLLWARLLTWVDKDTVALRLPREMLNLPLLGGFLLAFVLFFALPNFFLALGAVIVLFGAEVGIYLNIRGKKEPFSELQKQFGEYLRGLGGKSFEKKIVIPPGQVSVLARSGEPMQAPPEDAPERSAYNAIQAALREPLEKGAEQIELAPETDGVVTKYLVDGVTYRGSVADRGVGAAAIAMLKQAAGLNVQEVRKPQTGTFKVQAENKKRDVKVQTAGTRAGEFMRLTIDPKKRPIYRVDDLGFNPTQLEQIKQVISERKGIVLLSTPKGGGLTTLLHGMLRGHDAFIELLHSIERESEGDVEGVTQNRIPPTETPEEEARKVDWIISQEPDVLAISPVESPRSAAQLIDFAKSEKLVYVGIRAASTFEAVEQWKKLVGDPKLAVEALRYVISGRVLRKLCDACKAGYTPDPATLKKLGVNPERVTTLYQARTQPLRDEKGNPLPCVFCHELHFKGRTGVYETMQVDDDLREAFASGKSPNQLFRKQRGKYLQEEALALVEQGQTSVQEVLRVLKAAPAASSSSAPPPVPPQKSSGQASASQKPRPQGGAPAVRKG